MTEDAVTKQKTQVATPAELAAAREARGMSQVDISQRIKLQVKQVNALEQGQWEALPGKSFVRGALRSYAKLLDVDVAPLLESIGGFAEPSQVHGVRPLDTAISRSSGLGFNGGGRGSPILWVIASLLGIVALVLYFGSEGDTSKIRSWLPSSSPPSGTTVEPAPAPSPSGLNSPPAPSGSSTSSTPPASPSVLNALQVLPRHSPASAPTAEAGSPAALSAPSSAPAMSTAGHGAESASMSSASSAAAGASGPGGGHAAASTAAASPAPDAGPATTAAPATNDTIPAPAAAPGATAAAPGASAAGADSKGLMRLKAAQDAWVEVRQADGSALHNGLLKAGSSIDLKGNPPYRLVLGNALQVQLSYEGKVQDLAPHTRANNIARLQLK